MMTLDEAKNAENVANELLKQAWENQLLKINDWVKLYKRCAEEQKQLAEWLKELKRLKEQEHCEDAISRKAMLDYQQYLHGRMSNEENHKLWEFIKGLPSITPAHENGKWLDKDTSGYHFYGRCSECGQEFVIDAWYTQNMKYCPNCGARMENN